jgi:hypothetical protein
MHVVLSDPHVPDHDPDVLDLAVRFIRRIRPVALHLLGDIPDFLQLSKYCYAVDRVARLQDGINATKAVIQRLIRALPARAPVYYSEGNHEDRLQRYLRRNARALESLSTLTVPRLLELPPRVRWFSRLQPYRMGHLWFSHGHLVRKWSGYTARAMLEHVGGNVITGHCHRLASVHQTNWGGDYAGWENGCIQRLNPEYITGRPNWQHGWSVVTFHRSGLFCVEQVRVMHINGQPPCYFWRGQLIRHRRRAVA